MSQPTPTPALAPTPEDIADAFASGILRVYRQGTITDATGTRQRLCVTPKIGGRHGQA